MRLGWVRAGALAAAVAMLLVTACSAQAAGPPPKSASDAAGYWNRSRLINAQPLSAGLHAAPTTGQVPSAHTAPAPRCGSGRCSSTTRAARTSARRAWSPALARTC